MQWSKDRWGFATRMAAWHLLFSMFVAMFAAILVFKGWYAAPYDRVLGVSAVIVIVVVVDVVCGPLLNFLLSNPQKTRTALMVDWSMIAVIQVAALAYGMHSLWEARPVMLVFEVDRFVVVTANEVDKNTLKNANSLYRDLPFMGAKIAAVRKAKDSDEMMRSLDMSLGGIEPSARPDWWIPYENAKIEVREKAKSLQGLIAKDPIAKEKIQLHVNYSGQGFDSLLYLPLTSNRSKEWIAILANDSLLPIGYAPIDGF